MTFLYGLFWVIAILAVAGLILWYSKSRKEKKGGAIAKTEDIGKTEEPKPEFPETPEQTQEPEEPKF